MLWVLARWAADLGDRLAFGCSRGGCLARASAAACLTVRTPWLHAEIDCPNLGGTYIRAYKFMVEVRHGGACMRPALWEGEGGWGSEP